MLYTFYESLITFSNYLLPSCSPLERYEYINWYNHSLVVLEVPKNKTWSTWFSEYWNYLFSIPDNSNYKFIVTTDGLCRLINEENYLIRREYKLDKFLEIYNLINSAKSKIFFHPYFKLTWFSYWKMIHFMNIDYLINIEKYSSEEWLYLLRAIPIPDPLHINPDEIKILHSFKNEDEILVIPFFPNLNRHLQLTNLWRTTSNFPPPLVSRPRLGPGLEGGENNPCGLF